MYIYILVRSPFTSAPTPGGSAYRWKQMENQCKQLTISQITMTVNYHSLTRVLNNIWQRWMPFICFLPLSLSLVTTKKFPLFQFWEKSSNSNCFHLVQKFTRFPRGNFISVCKLLLMHTLACLTMNFLFISKYLLKNAGLKSWQQKGIL